MTPCCIRVSSTAAEETMRPILCNAIIWLLVAWNVQVWSITLRINSGTCCPIVCFWLERPTQWMRRSPPIIYCKDRCCCAFVLLHGAYKMGQKLCPAMTFAKKHLVQRCNWHCQSSQTNFCIVSADSGNFF